MKNSWICIKEKLPEKEGLYLVVYRSHINDKYFHYGLLNFIKLQDNQYGFKWENICGNINLNNYVITHWATFEKISGKITMEYKFKTVYGGELVPCIPVESNNLIIRVWKMLIPQFLKMGKFLKMGRLREEIGWMEELPVLPIFQYLNLKDSDFNEVYVGHIIRFCADNSEWIIKWSDKYHCYKPAKIIDGEWIDDRELYVLNYHSFKIIGHEALK